MFKPLPTIIIRLPRLSISVIKKALVDNTYFENIIFSSEFKEAIYVTSPPLYEELLKYENSILEGKEKVKIKNTLLKYLSRMSTRCTPFGNFAGCLVGRIDDITKIKMLDEEQELFRLDTSCLYAIEQKIAISLRKDLNYRVNSTIYECRDKIRYVNLSYINAEITYKIEEVKKTQLLISTLKTLSKPISYNSIVSKLCEISGFNKNEIETYVDQLIDKHILICEIEPFVTGNDYFSFLEKTINGKDVKIDNNINDIGQLLRKINIEKNPLHKIEIIKELEQTLQNWNIPFNKQHCIQLDTIRKAEVSTISKNLIKQIEDCLVFLKKNFTQNIRNQLLEDFKQKFTLRYEEQEIPLLEALDPELGIGFGSQQRNPESSFIKELDLPKANTTINHLFQYLYECLTNSGLKEIQLSNLNLQIDKEIADDSLPLSLSAMFHLTFNSELKRYQIFNLNFYGNSAGNLIARFADCDQQIKELLQQIVTTEQNCCEDVVLSEITHIPSPRVGNILRRPIIRNAEISYLSNSTRNENEIIPLSDLYVSIQNNKIILRSKKLNKIIEPRLTTAHNFHNQTTALYQFLCELQRQDKYSGLLFSWGDLDNKFTYYPRVLFKDIILSPAKWRFNTKNLSFFNKEKNKVAFEKWRNKHSLPRYVYLVNGDNKLYLDLENEECVSIFIAEIKNKYNIVILEEFIGCEKAITDNGGNSYMNEFIVSFVQKDSSKTTKPFSTIKIPSKLQRNFFPKDKWIYIKIYMGILTSDKLMTDVLYPYLQNIMKKRLVSKWFFVRYSDPNFHIRLRMYIDDTDYWGSVLTSFNKAVKEFCKSGEIHQIDISTYKREIERYGSNAINITESIFCHDSICVCSILQQIKKLDSNLRWKVAIKMIDSFLDTFNYTIEKKYNLLFSLDESFKSEFGYNKYNSKQLNVLFRKYRDDIETILDPTKSPDILQIKVQEAIDSRNKRIKALWEQSGFEHINISSCIHMMMNRLFPAQNRTYELLIYNFLARHYKSCIARSIKKEQLI